VIVTVPDVALETVKVPDWKFAKLEKIKTPFRMWT